MFKQFGLTPEQAVKSGILRHLLAQHGPKGPWFELGDMTDETLPDNTRLTKLPLEVGNLSKAQSPKIYLNRYLTDSIPNFVFTGVDKANEVVQIELKCGEKTTGMKTLTGNTSIDVGILTENTDVWDEALEGTYSIINMTILVKNKEK